MANAGSSSGGMKRKWLDGTTENVQRWPEECFQGQSDAGWQTIPLEYSPLTATESSNTSTGVDMEMLVNPSLLSYYTPREDIDSGGQAKPLEQNGWVESVAEDMLLDQDNIVSLESSAEINRATRLENLPMPINEERSQRVSVALSNPLTLDTYLNASREISIEASVSEVQVNDNEEEEFSIFEDQNCYGMLTIGSIEIYQQKSIQCNEGWLEVELKYLGPTTIVNDKNTSICLGTNSCSIAPVLADITQNFGIAVKGVLRKEEKVKKFKKYYELEKSYELFVLIYGSKENGPAVGKVLSDNEIYLQRPLPEYLDIDYHNPQSLGGLKSHFQPLESGKVSDRKSVLQDNFADEGAKREVMQIFDTAQGPQEFTATQSSSRILTSLKLHQLKALAMMIEKESGPSPSSEFMLLWQPVKLKGGRETYRNNVNGMCLPRPEICFGGLSADDMGLGKTLTTLALVAASLDRNEHDRTVGNIDHLSRYNGKTLIVTTKSNLLTWGDEVTKHTKRGSIGLGIYHGSRRLSATNEFSALDVVLTTYSTLRADYYSQSIILNEVNGWFKSQVWERVVLDEAHFIRNRETDTHNAVCKLKARYRWCLTGSPVQNSLEDFEALLQFLQAFPYHDRGYFKIHIIEMIKKHKKKGVESLKRLVYAVSLRRTKSLLHDELCLPRRIYNFIRVEFSPMERKVYTIFQQYAGDLATAQTLSKNSLQQSVLGILSKLRRFCNHDVKMALYEVIACDICGTRVSGMHALEQGLPCLHVICKQCELLVEAAESQVDGCLLCSGVEMGETTSQKNYGNNDIEIPSKINKLIRNLKHERASHNDAEVKTKSIVFTAWTKTLDLLEVYLNQRGFPYGRVDGANTVEKTRQVLQDFRESPKPYVLLATIGTAGTGLDLTAASRVHLIEPQWNPKSEAQALDRVYRIGQSNDVEVYRYIVEDSIEEEVWRVQQLKLETISQSFGDEPHDSQYASLMTTAFLERGKRA